MVCSNAVDDPECRIDEEDKHIWSTLLDEVTHKAAVTLSSSKTLIVLGDNECGKTTLVARLQGNEDPKKGFGLEYTLLNIKDEDRDDCMVIITINMAEPWNIVDSLEKWADILRKHVNRLKISEEKLMEHKMKVLHQFSSYLEPDALCSTIPPPSLVSIPKVSTPNIKRPSNIHPATAALLSGSLSSAQIGDFDNLTNDIDETVSVIESSLGKSILTCNLGIPLIVVVTKTDSMNNLEKEERFTDEHFDFIQMHIRRFCLSYGAALFYFSVKEDKNCDLLNRYIQSRLYGFPFNQAAYVVERDCIFVPSGWDNEKKISIQVENLTQVKPQSPYSEVIPRPLPKKNTVRETELLAQDEQTFLTRLSAIIQRENSQPNASNNSSSPGASDALVNQLVSVAALPGSRQVSGSPRTPVTNRVKVDINVIGGTGIVQGGVSGSGPSDSVLANFFNNLLNKRPPVTGSPGNVGVGTVATSVVASPGIETSSDKTVVPQKDVQSELEQQSPCESSNGNNERLSNQPVVTSSQNETVPENSDNTLLTARDVPAE